MPTHLKVLGYRRRGDLGESGKDEDLEGSKYVLGFELLKGSFPSSK
jgi:hypothetical protein